jgi:cytosine deaminase
LEGLLQRVAIPPVLRGFASSAAANQAFDVRWHEGHLARIEPVAGAPEGTLLSAPVDVHVHIDKNYTVDEVGEARGDLGAAIARMKASRAGWTADQLRARMTRALEDAWRCGTRALRTHIDWPDPLPPPSLPVLMELR